MRRMLRTVSDLLALGLFVGGCYGPFNLTRRLYQWNGQVGDTWEKEIVFLLLALTPVYGLTVAGDAIVFNSMEFWTGKNPVDAPSKRSDVPQTKRIVQGTEEALLTYTPTGEGANLLVQQFHQGQPAGTLRIRQHDGMTEGRNGEGKLMMTAQALPDGGVVIRDGQGKSVTSYSASEVQRVMDSARR